MVDRKPKKCQYFFNLAIRNFAKFDKTFFTKSSYFCVGYSYKDAKNLSYTYNFKKNHAIAEALCVQIGTLGLGFKVFFWHCFMIKITSLELFANFPSQVCVLTKLNGKKLQKRCIFVIKQCLNSGFNEIYFI